MAFRRKRGSTAQEPAQETAQEPAHEPAQIVLDPIRLPEEPYPSQVTIDAAPGHDPSLGLAVDRLRRGRVTAATGESTPPA